MIWFILIAIVLFIVFKFMNDLNKDKYDLQGTTLDEKFKVVVNMLNKAAFDGNGNITKLDSKSFNLYEKGSNQIINFHYGTGTLTITWRYKYFQKEVVHSKDFYETRNLSLFEQQKIADEMIYEMIPIIENHKTDVMKGII